MQNISRTDFVVSGRLFRLSFALFLALILAVSFLAVHPEKPSSVSRGDFPAFYSAASIVYSGRGAELYDQDLQRQVQNQFWPELSGNYLSFAYPPFFAFLLMPLALFSPVVAKLLFLGVLTLCVYASVYLVCSTLGVERWPYVFSLFVLLLIFAPLTLSIAAGQNTALSLLLFVVAASNAELESQGRKYLAGAALGLWLFKPHFPLLVMIALFLSGRMKKEILLGFLLVATFYFYLGGIVMGESWPLLWWKAAMLFSKQDFLVNGYQMVSLQAVVEKLLSTPWARELGGVLSAVFFLSISRYLLRRDEGFFLVLGCLLVLCAGHVLFYDMAIGALSVIQMLARGIKTNKWYLIIGWLLAWIFTAYKSVFFFSPLVFLTVAMFAIVYSELRKDFRIPEISRVD